MGVLKKIEAKSSVLLVIVVFALPTLISQMEVVEKLNSSAVKLIYFVLGILLPVLASAAYGAGHLGQSHFRKKIVKKCAEPIWGRELQRSLIVDMLEKEAAFRICYGLLFLAAGVFGVAYLWISLLSMIML